MKSIEFYDLPRPIQERFVAASQASLAPAPLAVKLASRYVGARWFIAALVGFVATLAYAARGVGDLESADALATTSHALIYCIGFTISFGCLTRGLILRDRALSLPYARATYLFPVGVVDAVSSSLEVHSLEDLDAVEAKPDALEVTFKDGATFVFPARDQKEAEAAKQAITQSRERLDEATRADSVRHLAALDPLCRTNFPSPFSQDAPFQRPRALWATLLLVTAVVSGTALGFGVWRVRNTVSARQLAVAARSANTTEAYRQYIARGGEHPEIVEVLLPRAELAEAREHGNVAAIEAYIAEHPSSKIQGEVDAALKAALLAALDKAKAQGTLAALAAFAAQYPRHEPVRDELRAARHEVYEAAARRAKQLSVAGSGRRNNPAAFFEKLVAYAEAHGPKVVVRFRSQLGKSYRTADNTVRSTGYFGGNASLPSRFFDDEHMRRREALAAPLLVQALQSLFPREIVEFELGERLAPVPLDERAPPLPDPAVPTLYIDHRTELSGPVVNKKPRGMFFGAGIFFDTSFVIPGNDTSLEITVPTWRGPTRHVMQHEARTTADVYEDLARRAFSMFLRRYLDRVLREPPDVAVPEIELPPEKDTKEG